MRNARRPYAFALCLLAVGCATVPKMSPMQFRHISTRLIEGRYDNVFRSAMTVLQDNGYIIKQTNMDTGLITAEVNREISSVFQVLQVIGSKQQQIRNKGTLVEASAVVSKISDTNTEVRITIQERTYTASGGTSRVRQLRDATIYKKLFDDITIEVRRREAMGG